MKEHIDSWAIAPFLFKLFLLFLMEGITLGILASFPIARWIVRQTNKYIMSAKENRDRRNFLYSFAFFVQDLGPGIAAYGIVGMVINSSNYAGDFLDFILVIFLGIIIKEMGRNMKNVLAKKLGERK